MDREILCEIMNDLVHIEFEMSAMVSLMEILDEHYERKDQLELQNYGEYPKDCVNLQTDVRYNYSVWRFLKWQEKRIRHKKQ